MKKQLLRVLSLTAGVLALSACSSEYDFESKHNTETEREKTYNEIFVAAFGEPDAYHSWGFGSSDETRANNPGENYAETSTGINANANEWADTIGAPHGHGGWIVPNPLTEEQKAVVAAYFQTVKDLTYTDPQWRHFFVQQVYTGGNSTVRNTTEGITAANGTTYTSANMNLLTVGYNEQHINNFNAGTYSGAGLNTYDGGTNDDGSVNVLDSGYHVNEFAEHHHADQIMLMVNIDDTECMGYHCSATGLSQQVNNKAAIVGWETIDSWAKSNYTGYNGCLNDGWDRSYVGFDLALKSQEDSYAKGENGEALYATFTDVPDNNNMQYVWDGTKTIKIGTAPEPSSPDLTSKLATAHLWAGTMTEDNGVYVYNYDDWGGFDFAINGENWTGYTKMVIEFAEATPAEMNVNIKNNGGDVRLADVAWDAAVTKLEIDLTEKARDNVSQVFIQTKNGPFKFSKIELIGEATTVEYYDPSTLSLRLMDSNMNQYAGESRTITDDELQITVDDKLCLNLKTINDLLAEGFLPVNGSALKTWAKWADSDGYYSDWIVTLNEAQRQDTPTPDPDPTYYSRRVIAEDLGTAENTDFDYNDVVFDVVQDEANTTVTLRAAGGTLPLYLVVFKSGTTIDEETYSFDPSDSNIEWSQEVHAWYDVPTSTMVNTNNGTVSKDVPTPKVFTRLIEAGDVHIFVNKGGFYTITARVGRPAQKLAVGTDFKWLNERVSIIDQTYYGNFLKYVKNEKVYGADSYKLWYNENPEEVDETLDGQHQGTIGL